MHEILMYEHSQIKICTLYKFYFLKLNLLKLLLFKSKRHYELMCRNRMRIYNMLMQRNVKYSFH